LESLHVFFKNNPGQAIPQLEAIRAAVTQPLHPTQD
jgi:hypothetical protein